MNTGLRRGITLTAGALTLLSISACAQAKPEPPQASESASTAPTSENKSIPKIEDPKNVKAITEACNLLTPKQLAQLGGGGKPRPSTSMYGETECRWSNDNFAVNIAVNTKYGGPTNIFGAPQSADNFARTQVSGYPAARVNKQSTTCAVEVAVAKGQSVEVYYFLHSGDAPAMQKPCQYAEKIAAEVLENIPDA